MQMLGKISGEKMSEAERENTDSGNLSKFELAVVELIMHKPDFVFSREQYLQENHALTSTGIDPLMYYVLVDWRNLQQIPVQKGYFQRFVAAYRKSYFDEEFYLQSNSDVVAVGVEPFMHFLIVGANQGRRPNALTQNEADGRLVQLLQFNYVKGAYYLQRYPQVKEQQIHPAIHYAFSGWKNGFLPNDEEDCKQVEAELQQAVAAVSNVEQLQVVAPELQAEIINVYAAYKNAEADYAGIETTDTDIYAFYPQILQKSYSELNKVYQMLADNESKRVFAGIILARMINNNTVYLFVQAEYPQYLHPEVKAREEDIILDLGAAEGYTSKSPLKRTGGKALVYSFEPGKTSFLNVLKNHENFKYKDRMIPVNLGTWSEKKRVFFSDDDATGSARVVPYKTDFYIDVIDIDTFVQENNIEYISLIKMDIEGSEMETLKGALGTINKFRPRLQISIYHNNYSDLFVLPEFINELNLGYRFYVGHHSSCFCETVLYCTCD